MNRRINKANENYVRYFKKEILDNGAGYVVSNDTAVIGFFSFAFLDDKHATFNFPFCLDKEAIALALNTFMADYPMVEVVNCLSRQKLDDLGFQNQIYQKER